MSLFCEDQDLLGWESGIFGNAGVAHLALVKDADATLSGGTLLMSAAVLGPVTSGMVTVLRQGTGDSLVQTLAVVTTVLAANQASVSVLRAAGEDPTAPAMSGAVKVTVVSFHPVISAVGDELLALLGVESRMLTGVSTVMGLKTATIFGALAAVFRAIGPSADADKKLALYTRLYQLARRAISGWVDADGDGVAERRVCAGLAVMEREQVECPVEFPDGLEGNMFEMMAQASADTLLPVAQFGVAGLMGGLWWWERRYSREREEQLTQAHELIINQREHLSSLLEALQNNTRAVAEFTEAQREIVRLLQKRK